MKRIIICCDGTGADQNKHQPSNVLLTYRAVKDQPDQKAWYDPGVGTGSTKEKIWGGATGDGLTRNIEQAYLQLVEHYEEGDEIFLFGFSRGAYTVRSLGGLIRNIGLLYPENTAALNVGFELYTNKKCGPDSGTAKRFRATNSRNVTVKFMGVYDTVGSMGVLQKWISDINGYEEKWFERWGFHDFRLSSLIETGYQALAIDEKRRAFRPQIWDDPKYDTQWPEEANDDCPKIEKDHSQWFSKSPLEPTEEEIKADKDRRENQYIEQKWFRGCHTDIGGGNDPPGLSNLTLHWMLDAAKQKGLLVDTRYLQVHANPQELQKVNESRTGFYRLQREFFRPIDTRDRETESLHESVCSVYKDPEINYRPKNLVDYLKRDPKACEPAT
ncbi:MAG: DUF2235 domain-containing protein [Chloroflexi bacterium]|nr:DUF2235 domain-containing protein [Chloroflexota bacterium]